MSGTKIGALKAAQKNKELYGEDYYRNMGRKGGSVLGVVKGFAQDPERAREAGRLGGSRSKRGPSKKLSTGK